MCWPKNDEPRTFAFNKCLALLDSGAFPVPTLHTTFRILATMHLSVVRSREESQEEPVRKPQRWKLVSLSQRDD